MLCIQTHSRHGVRIHAPAYPVPTEQTARMRRSDGALMDMDLESDDVEELAGVLWEIVGGYGNDRIRDELGD
ncbi:hypothetical protein BDR03DRAFT_958859, partial [Suillus americanus]